MLESPLPQWYLCEGSKADGHRSDAANCRAFATVHDDLPWPVRVYLDRDSEASVCPADGLPVGHPDGLSGGTVVGAGSCRRIPLALPRLDAFTLAPFGAGVDAMAGTVKRPGPRTGRALWATIAATMAAGSAVGGGGGCEPEGRIPVGVEQGGGRLGAGVGAGVAPLRSTARPPPSRERIEETAGRIVGAQTGSTLRAALYEV